MPQPELTLRIKTGWTRFIDTVLPPRAALNEAGAAGPGDLHDWAGIRFLDDPLCRICGFPFEFDQGPDALCAYCLAKAPSYDSARAALAYDDASRDMVLEFKHGGYLDNLDMFAAHMARAGRGFLGEADFIIPVPLHPRRLIKRRYNQATILGRAVAGKCDAIFDSEILWRRKPTPSQAGKSASARKSNVAGAFMINEKARERLNGGNIVLIDDVMTTGSTLSACTKALKRGGAQRVDALVLARVVKARAIPT